MTTFINAINEAKEWKLQGSVRNGELQISNKSGRCVIKINALGEITYQAAGYDNSAKDISSKVLSKINTTQHNTAQPNVNSDKTEWLVNGDKVIHNNLSYNEMWNRYGTDFE